MVNAPDIVRSIVNAIQLEAKVISIVAERIYLCSTLHITIGKTVKDELDNEYEVTDMAFDDWIEVKPKGASPAQFAGPIVKAQALLFFHGTPMSINDQISNHESRDLQKVTPFVWLVAGYDYEEHGRESSIDATLTGVIRFLDWSNSQKFTNDQHNELVIKPMQNLVNAFSFVVDNDFSFKTRDAFTSKDRVRFGVEAANKGDSRGILDIDCGGVESRIELEIYDTEQCVSGC